jgi:hypothetical protein
VFEDAGRAVMARGATEETAESRKYAAHTPCRRDKNAKASRKRREKDDGS